MNDPWLSIYVSWSSVEDAGSPSSVSYDFAQGKRYEKRMWWVDPLVVIELKLEVIILRVGNLGSIEPNIVDQYNR